MSSEQAKETKGPWMVRMSKHTGEYYAEQSIYCRFNRALAKERCSELNNQERLRDEALAQLASLRERLEAAEMACDLALDAMGHLKCFTRDEPSPNCMCIKCSATRLLKSVTSTTAAQR